MAFDGIDRDTDDLHTALFEFRLQAAHGAEFGGADRRKILRMRKQDRPAIANPVVKAYRTMGGLGGEVGRYIVDTQAHLVLSP